MVDVQTFYAFIHQYIEKFSNSFRWRRGRLEARLSGTANSSAVWQYGFAILSVAVALGITNSLERHTTLRTPLFYIAVIISAWFGGMGPGLLVVALSTLVVGYYFAPGSQMPT